MKGLSKLTLIIVFVSVSLLILQVVVANRLANAGLVLTDIETQKATILEENELLERKIASLSSLVNISQRAAEAGFTNARSYYLPVQLPVAWDNHHGTTQ